VKAFDCEVFEAEMYSKSLEGVYDVDKTTSYLHAAKDGLITLYMWLMIAGLMDYTLYIIVRKPYLNLEPGDMMVLMMSLMLGTMGISQALGMIDDFKKAGIAAAKLLEIIERSRRLTGMLGSIQLMDSRLQQGGSSFATSDSNTQPARISQSVI
jgi:hypothetical protein